METTMWIASCTKLMTAISVLQCVERGLLDLDADVASVLPEWKDAVLLKGFEEGSGKPILETAKQGLNLRHLLTHSSGLGYIPFDPRLQRWAEAEGRVLSDDSSLVCGLGTRARLAGLIHSSTISHSHRCCLSRGRGGAMVLVSNGPGRW
jgi:CubicO group peptidase (beta-lactamase class C family)